MQSLRWEVSPQDGLDNIDSTSEWLDFFNGVGFKLQQLISKRKRKKMVLLEKNISELQGKLDPIKGTQQLINFDNEIKKRLEKIDKETQKKKFKKFRRDTNDLKKNSINLWQNTESPLTSSVEPIIDNVSSNDNVYGTISHTNRVNVTPAQTKPPRRDNKLAQSNQNNRVGAINSR